MTAGQVLGPFEVVRELGSGAMGAVFLARYTKTGVLVAIKVMNASMGSNERALARFEREADMLKQLRHPNIVRLLATGKYKKSPFYAMEYIEGENLDQILQHRERIPWEEVVEIGRQVCAALQHAHNAGIVHRDLKPSNLMMTEDGTVKLTDFGIAKDLDVTQLTTANHTVGTASYMSPEQCRGERDLTFKSDLYSLGIVLYELLTGRKPFIAENVMDMFMAHVSGRFERPARIVFDLPVWLDTLVCQLLEKKPELRPRDAAMVAEVLNEIRAKSETQRSAGADIATQVARKGSTLEDKLAAKALLASKKKKKKPGMSRKRKELWFKVVGLSTFLVVLIGLMTWLLWPDPRRDLQKARKSFEDWSIQMKADADSGDFSNAQAKAYDLDKLLIDLSASSSQDVRDEARLMGDALDAGGQYVKVQRIARAKSPEDLFKDREFETAYGRLLRAGSKPNKYLDDGEFINYPEKGRRLIQPLEAPVLLAEGKEFAAKDAADWSKAREKWDLLRQRYPSSDEAKQAERLLNRLTAREWEKKIGDDWEERKKKGELFKGLSDAATAAMKALDAEQTNRPQEAEEYWNQLAVMKVQPADQPLILLAKYKLKLLEE